MTSSKGKRITLLLFCVSLSALWSYSIREHSRHEIRMTDFGVIYYASRSALHHQDPYDAAAVLREFRAGGSKFPADSSASKAVQTVVTNCINLPTTLFLAIPLALLPWSAAQNLWMILIAALLFLSAYLTWDLAEDHAPLLAGCMFAFMLADCELLLTVGNSAGIAVTSCVIAACCFLKARHAWVGILLLAVSLVIKPHDSGFVWLYFLLAGGALRKRALQTLAVVVLISLLATIWIMPSSPHWINELHNNIAAERVPGGVSDPSMSGALSKSVGQLVDLQVPLSLFQNAPHFYNPASYLIDGVLILAWAIAVLRKRISLHNARLALAAIAALSLLPVYHWTHDAKLIMLAVPACVMLWSTQAPLRWVALLLTSAAIFVTADLPLAVLSLLAKKLPISTATVSGKLTILFFLRPAPLILLALGCFYLWAFLRDKPVPTGNTHHNGATSPDAA
jgi:Glycosyltransferase family 87